MLEGLSLPSKSSLFSAKIQQDTPSAHSKPAVRSKGTSLPVCGLKVNTGEMLCLAAFGGFDVLFLDLSPSNPKEVA